ncbi:hypothetical protein ACFZDG_28565 [Kitasatospora xanthocidica]|uniref:hypothetical protein n=1 Tax=Kitasatospora xanthocidica TaxID=83382 RepID=UPI0036EE9132
MRIERHQVDQSAISAAREGFVDRIGGMVHSYSRAGLMTATEWRLIAEEFLDYLGALSADSPALDTPEAKAVLKDATEAAAGAIAFAAYYPHDRFHVFLDYPNFGMGYDPEEADGTVRRRIVLPQYWLDALCLAILSDKVARHGEAFAFTWKSMPAGGGYSAAQLVNGLMAHLFGDTRDQDAPHPATAEQRLAAIDTALAHIEDRDSEAALALRTLRALAAEDRAAFDTGMLSLLDHTGGTRPRSLLPCSRWPWPRSPIARTAGSPPSTPTTCRAPWSPASRAPAPGSGASAATGARTPSPGSPPGPSASTGRPCRSPSSPTARPGTSSTPGRRSTRDPTTATPSPGSRAP